jgi:cell wall assembly regulator SMI1
LFKSFTFEKMNILKMEETLNFLIATALEKTPNLKFQNNESSTIKNIEDLEKIVGKKLPQDFIDLYLITDGNAPGSIRLFNGLRLLSIAEISQQWLTMQEIKASGAFVINGKQILADADRKMRNEWWNTGWLPITDNLNGDYTVIDLDPNTKGNHGQIIEYWHDVSFRNVLAPSLKDWLIHTTNDIKNGVLKYDQNYEGFVSFT